MAHNHNQLSAVEVPDERIVVAAAIIEAFYENPGFTAVVEAASGLGDPGYGPRERSIARQQLAAVTLGGVVERAAAIEDRRLFM
jgi:hypothetical protein